MINADERAEAANPTSRVRIFDLIRGLCVLSMVGFHFCYDLVELRAIQISWFQGAFEDVWRASISWTFLALAGVMCSYSKSNLKRAFKYGAVAVAIWVATTVVAVDTPITFGIIFCMAASTLIYTALQKCKFQPKGLVAGLICFALFLLTLKLPSGNLSLLGNTVAVPKELYSTEWFSWLGFPGPKFSSGDYYPLLPYSLMYLAGASLGPGLRDNIPKAVKSVGCKPLEFIGRYALEVYVLHQPILLLIAGLF